MASNPRTAYRQEMQRYEREKPDWAKLFIQLAPVGYDAIKGMREWSLLKSVNPEYEGMKGIISFISKPEVSGIDLANAKKRISKLTEGENISVKEAVKKIREYDAGVKDDTEVKDTKTSDPASVNIPTDIPEVKITPGDIRRGKPFSMPDPKKIEGGISIPEQDTGPLKKNLWEKLIGVTDTLEPLSPDVPVEPDEEFFDEPIGDIEETTFDEFEKWDSPKSVEEMFGNMTMEEWKEHVGMPENESIFSDYIGKSQEEGELWEDKNYDRLYGYEDDGYRYPGEEEFTDEEFEAFFRSNKVYPGEEFMREKWGEINKQKKNEKKLRKKLIETDAKDTGSGGTDFDIDRKEKLAEIASITADNPDTEMIFDSEKQMMVPLSEYEGNMGGAIDNILAKLKKLVPKAPVREDTARTFTDNFKLPQNNQTIRGFDANPNSLINRLLSNVDRVMDTKAVKGLGDASKIVGDISAAKNLLTSEKKLENIQDLNNRAKEIQAGENIYQGGKDVLTKIMLERAKKQAAKEAGKVAVKETAKEAAKKAAEEAAKEAAKEGAKEGAKTAASSVAPGLDILDAGATITDKDANIGQKFGSALSAGSYALLPTPAAPAAVPLNIAGKVIKFGSGLFNKPKPPRYKSMGPELEEERRRKLLKQLMNNQGNSRA